MFTQRLLKRKDGVFKSKVMLVLQEYVDYPSHSHKQLEKTHYITHKQLNYWLYYYLQPEYLRGSCYKRK